MKHAIAAPAAPNLQDASAAQTAPQAVAASSRTRSFSDAPEQGRLAAELLLTPNALTPLSLEDAAVVVAHMRLVSFNAGAVLLREGDREHLDHMLLVLHGQVSVSTQTGGQTTEVSVLGPGALIGEMALLDGAPRSTTCTAVTAVQSAGMSRKGLEMLIVRQPAVAARLMVCLSCRLAERLRAMSEQLTMLAGIGAGR